MLHTLADARKVCERYVDAGSCSPTTTDARINEALERLIDGHDWECMRKILKITTCKKCFSLPYNVEKIMWVDVNGTPGRVYGLPYQFLSSGPGDLDARMYGSGLRDILDKGDDWPVMFDIPSEIEVNDVAVPFSNGLQLLAFSTEASDVGKSFRVQGVDVNSREINPGTYPGVEVAIHRWKGGTMGRTSGTWDAGLVPTTQFFGEVTRIVKDITAGPITLYAVDTATNYFFFLGEYHPLVKIPQFRRYSITNTSCGCNTTVLALVKLRHVYLTQPTDIVPVDSLQAVKLMCLAIRQENAGDIAGGAAYAEQALKLMGDREKSRTACDGTPIIINRSYRTSLGRYTNRGGYIL